MTRRFLLSPLIILLLIFLSASLSGMEVYLLNHDFPDSGDLTVQVDPSLTEKEIKDNLDVYLADQGYILTSVSLVKKSTNRVMIALTEGWLADVKIEVSGKISPALLSSYIGFKQGDLFNEIELQRKLKRLFQTGLFSNITYQLYRAKRILIIHLAVLKKNLPVLNGNISAKTGLSFYGGIRDRRFFFPQLDSRIGAEAGVLPGGLTFFRTDTEHSFHGFTLYYMFRDGICYAETDAYKEKENIFNLSLSLKYRKDLFFRFGLQTDHHIFRSHESLKNRYVLPGWRLSASMGLFFFNDFSIVERRKENFFNLEFEAIQAAENGRFLRGQAKSRYFFSILSRHGLIIRSSSGYILGSPLPFDLMFALGGVEQRGLNVEALLSRSYLSFSAEGEADIYRGRLFFHVFSDLVLFDRNGRIDKNLGLGVGISLKVLKFLPALYYCLPVSPFSSRCIIHIRLEQTYF